MKSVSLLLTAFTGLTLTCHAAVRVAWTARYTVSDVGTNQALALALDKDGNAIVGGHGTTTNGDFDYVILKYSPGGVLMWTARYGSPTNDQIRSMAVDRDGNTVLTGTSVTLRYDDSGVQAWNAPYGGRGVALDPHGDVHVTGFSSEAYATAKIHKQTGTNLWLRTYSYLGREGYPDISQAITVDSKSNVFVAGQVYCHVGQPIETYVNRLTISYDANGNERFISNPFPTDCIESRIEIEALGVDADGNLVESGNQFRWGQAFATRKRNTAGLEVWRFAWQSNLDYSSEEAMEVASDGSVLLCGSIYPYPTAPSSVYALIKLTANGEQSWVSRYGDTSMGNHRAKAIALDTAGNVYVTGQSPGPGVGNDYATIKYTPDGQELWVQRYDGPAHGDDVATAIAVTSDGSVYVTGWSTTSSNLIEITTIKYTQSPGLTLDTNRNAQLQFLGAPGSSNRVQATTDFFDWLDLGFSVGDTNGCLRFLDTNAPAYPHRFYRMVPP
jgi:uncharacterized delta-60 repeat protein